MKGHILKLNSKRKNISYKQKYKFSKIKNNLDIAGLAAYAASEKKGENILLLDVSKLTIVGDYFLIVTARSSVQVDAIANHVEETLLKADYKLLSKEGLTFSSWVILDFGNLVIHVMGNKERDYYKLEQFWGNAEIINKKIWENREKAS